MKLFVGLVIGLVLGAATVASARIDCLPPYITANVYINGTTVSCTVDTYGSSRYSLEINC